MLIDYIVDTVIHRQFANEPSRPPDLSSLSLTVHSCALRTIFIRFFTRRSGLFSLAPCHTIFKRTVQSFESIPAAASTLEGNFSETFSPPRRIILLELVVDLSLHQRCAQ